MRDSKLKSVYFKAKNSFPVPVQVHCSKGLSLMQRVGVAEYKAACSTAKTN
jgi:hypothetical protein